MTNLKTGQTVTNDFFKTGIAEGTIKNNGTVIQAKTNYVKVKVEWTNGNVTISNWKPSDLEIV